MERKKETYYTVCIYSILVFRGEKEAYNTVSIMVVPPLYSTAQHSTAQPT